MNGITISAAEKRIEHSDKARRLLGWAPVAEIDAGMRATIAWYAEFLRQPAA